MLRCMLAGMIPLMMSKKYAALGEVFYQFKKPDFENIMKNKSYYLIRDLPQTIAHRILAPEIPAILARQKNDGLWHVKDQAKTTYDILSAFKAVGVLDDLIIDGKLKNMMGAIRENTDYDSLLIKSRIFGHTYLKDIHAIEEMIGKIRRSQSKNGSWGNTVTATAWHMEKLMNLGVSHRDPSVQKGTAFLFGQCNEEWECHGMSGRSNGLKTGFVFSTGEREREFEAAVEYMPETMPRMICFGHLGVMQNAYCLKLLIRMGLEEDARIQAALGSILAIIKEYQSLCYFEIQKKLKTSQTIHAASY